MIKFIVKLILLAALVAGGYYGYQQLVTQRQLIQQENEATKLLNNEEFTQAAEIFEKLRQNLNGENRERVEKKLAQCYLALSKTFSLDIKAQAEYAAKALKIDPEADIGKTMKRYIQTILKPENRD